MSSGWVSLIVDVANDDAEAVQQLLHDFGVTGVEVRDHETQPMPGTRMPGPGESLLVAWFDHGADAAEIARNLRDQFPSARLSLESVPREDWSENWKTLIRSIVVGRLWVGPPWLLSGAPDDRERIVIEPKMAFGTGDHPSTWLCLEAIDAFLAGHPGASVLDVGTGTGVLAIAAKKLGARRVVGIDNDASALPVARENADVNGTSEILFAEPPLETIEGGFDLVVANIIANTLIDLAPAIAPKVKGTVLLSGVLIPQREEVERAYVAQGLVPAGGSEHGEWVRIDLRRP